MFDPSLPQEHTDLDAAEMRSQFTSLKSLIDAIISIVSAQVDSVTTLNPGDPATMSVSVINNELHFIVAIPRGDVGLQGIAGTDGAPGAQGFAGTDGAPGAQGPPFAQAMVDAVNTLLPGTDATVGVSFDGTNVHFTFGIPRGNDGIQGPPGEVTAAQLSAAIVGTSSNTNTVATMDTAPSDPPTFADYEALRSKINELILNGRR